MGFGSIFSKRRKLFNNRVSSSNFSPEQRRRSFIATHTQSCLCRQCKKEREQQLKQTCCALVPLIGLLALFGLVSA